jgi:CBS domain-containing protein
VEAAGARHDGCKREGTVAMKASDIMTRKVVSVSPETPVQSIAKAMLDHAISAVPVVDASGAVIGMVSEGDLIKRSEREHRERRSWWLDMLAEGHELAPDYLAYIRSHPRRAEQVMSSPAIAITEETEVPAIAELLDKHRIKRVPVVRDGRLVGIVSRANLLSALSAEV